MGVFTKLTYLFITDAIAVITKCGSFYKTGWLLQNGGTTDENIYVLIIKLNESMTSTFPIILWFWFCFWWSNLYASLFFLNYDHILKDGKYVMQLTNIMQIEHPRN